MSLGYRICEIRQSRNLTQLEISRKSGLAVTYLSRIENNRIEPSFTTLHKIAEALQVNLVDFFGYDERKRFQGQCPVSLSGRCVADLIYGTGRKGQKFHVEGYSARQIRLMRLSNFLIQFSDKKVQELLELLFLSLLRSPAIKKENDLLRRLSLVPTRKKQKILIDAGVGLR